MESNTKTEKPQYSATDLFSSAKVVAAAATSDKADKGEVAEAAADFLHTASGYAKLEEKGLDKYVDKAEEYLHQYKPANSSTTTPAAGEAAESEKKESGLGGYLDMAQGLIKKQSGEHGSGEEEKKPEAAGGGGSGAGGYLKMAEGFLKKN